MHEFEKYSVSSLFEFALESFSEHGERVSLLEVLLVLGAQCLQLSSQLLIVALYCTLHRGGQLSACTVRALKGQSHTAVRLHEPRREWKTAYFRQGDRRRLHSIVQVHTSKASDSYLIAVGYAGGMGTTPLPPPKVARKGKQVRRERKREKKENSRKP